MQFSNYYTLIFLSLLLIITDSCTEEKQETEQSPNILFIFADDMTYSAINALGNKEIYTPNLDRLVKEGVTFTHAYNMGGWQPAICMASRAMIISGRSLWDVNKYRENWIAGHQLNETWPKLMENRGYNTYFTGKWHIDASAKALFKTVVHERPGMPRDAWIERNDQSSHTHVPQSVKGLAGYDRPKNEEDSTWSSTDVQFGGYWDGGTHWSEVLRNDALAFIETAKNSEKPFFMYLAFNAPHDPRQAPQEFLDKYPLEKISLPKSYLPQYPYADSIGSGQGVRDEDLAPFPRTQYAVRKHTQEYYALISHMDQQIGILLDSLQKSGKKDNTYIIFTADHGLAIGRHGLLGKQNMFDHSVRVPFMILGPDIPKGKRVTSDIYLQDAMPTTLALANIPKPDYIFFNSVLDLAKGKTVERNYPEIYGAYTDTQRMIRKNKFKLIVYPKIKKLLLFNLESDPNEVNDLANLFKHRARLNGMFDELTKLQSSLNDTLVLGEVDVYFD